LGGASGGVVIDDNRRSLLMRRLLATIAVSLIAALASACSTGFGPAAEGYGSSIPPTDDSSGYVPGMVYHPGAGIPSGGE
jgi:hypothetical protein